MYLNENGLQNYTNDNFMKNEEHELSPAIQDDLNPKFTL